MGDITEETITQVIEDIFANGQQNAIRADWGHVLAHEVMRLRAQLAEAQAQRDEANSECKDWYSATIYEKATEGEYFHPVYLLHRKRLGLP